MAKKIRELLEKLTPFERISAIGCFAISVILLGLIIFQFFKDVGKYSSAIAIEVGLAFPFALVALRLKMKAYSMFSPSELDEKEKKQLYYMNRSLKAVEGINTPSRFERRMWKIFIILFLIGIIFFLVFMFVWLPWFLRNSGNVFNIG